MSVDFEVILNKVVGITEQNLQMQKEFITSIYELKTKLHEEAFSKEDLKEALKTMNENIDDIYALMGKVSNQEIINLLYSFREDKNTFSFMLKNYLDKFEQTDAKLAQLGKLQVQIKEFSQDFVGLKEKVITSNNLYKVVVSVLVALSIMVGGFQLMRSIDADKQSVRIEALINRIEEHEK